jgi:16S rRNA (uracil1498-N3)-methyltransferase
LARFFIDAELTEQMTLRGADAHHASHVLRLKPGAEILVVGRGGRAGRAKIAQITPAEVVLTVTEAVATNSEPPISVCLAHGLTKGDKMDYIVQKAVELGVNAVVPLLARHSVVHYDGAKQAARRERWQRIAAEAAKQCGRLMIPEVAACQDLAECLANRQSGTAVIMLYEGEKEYSLKKLLRNCQAASFLLVIGPEGGFSEREVTLCREQGAHTVSIGPRILRTETAALSALAIVMYECGDLGG